MKAITSQIERWPGTVTLRDTVGYPELIEFDDSIVASEEWLGEPLPNGYLSIKDVNRYRLARLPGLLQFIESHTLVGLPSKLTLDNFPAVPRQDATKLFAWLREEVSKIILGDSEKKDSESLGA